MANALLNKGYLSSHKAPVLTDHGHKDVNNLSDPDRQSNQ